MPAKLPSLDKLLTDPKARESLTEIQLYNFIQQLKTLASGLGRPDRTESNPADFAVRLSKGEWHAADHLRLLSSKLAAMERREQRFLAVSMPPRHGKSLLIDVWFPIWWLTRNPKSKIILAGYGETFARLWGAQVRDKLIEFGDETNVVISKDQTAADDWSTTLGGGMVCVGVGGSLVGRGADLLIIDDPIKNDQEANSQVYRDRMWNWWQASAFTRLQPNGVVVVVCTRWHEDDLIGRLERDNTTNRWEILRIPALAEKDDLLGRQSGAPLWPDQFPDDPDYKIRQGSMSPYWWASQFQQRPTPEGGGLIQRDWFRFYRSLPEDIDQWIQSWDPALLDKATSDYWVGQVWARKGASLYLVDSSRGHYNLAQASGIIRAWNLRYPKALAKIIESTAMGPAIIQTLQHEIPGIIPWPPRNRLQGRQGSKRARVEAIIPILMAGNVYLPENKDGTKPRWVWDLIEECAAFDKGTYDDQCFVAGTLVATPLGPRRIESLKTGQRVLIPGGWTRIKGVGQRFASVTTRLGLTGTPDHPVATSQGFIRLDALTQGADLCRLSLCGQIRWSLLRLFSFLGGRIDSWERDAIISLLPQAVMKEKRPRAFMWLYGRLSGIKNFLRLSSFTTKMKTLSTTILATWRASLEKNMLPFTVPAFAGQSNLPIWNRFVPWLLFGIKVQQEGNGIKSTLKFHTEPKLISAKIAERHFKLDARPTTVLISADTSGEPQKVSTTKSDTASYAVINSTTLRHSTQAEAVEHVVGAAEVACVYNISTEAGVYFANGILVHNCDALSQALSFLLPGAWGAQKKEDDAAAAPADKTPQQARADSFNAYTKSVLRKAARSHGSRVSPRARW